MRSMAATLPSEKAIKFQTMESFRWVLSKCQIHSLQRSIHVILCILCTSTCAIFDFQWTNGFLCHSNQVKPNEAKYKKTQINGVWKVNGERFGLPLAIDPGPHQPCHTSVEQVFVLLLFSWERVECQNKTFHFMTFRTRTKPNFFKHISRVSVFFHLFFIEFISEWRAFLFHNVSERKNTPIVRMKNVNSL